MKKILLAISFSLLSGCAAIDAYFMAKYDTTEYATISSIRTQAELAVDSCSNKKAVEEKIDEIYKTSAFFKNFTQLRERNEETATVAYNLYLLSEQLKKYYASHNEVSLPYCKLKLQQIEKGAITAQKAVGSKPR